MGSPPHTRGILNADPSRTASNGFTPAYAGNTLENCKIETVAQVHPRIRGEYSDKLSIASRLQGSPPHTRGIRDSAIQIVVRYRFTPAYAGNTKTSVLDPLDYRVHPRIRGEYGFS